MLRYMHQLVCSVPHMHYIIIYSVLCRRFISDWKECYMSFLHRNFLGRKKVLVLIHSILLSLSALLTLGLLKGQSASCEENVDPLTRNPKKETLNIAQELWNPVAVKLLCDPVAVKLQTSCQEA